MTSALAFPDFDVCAGQGVAFWRSFTPRCPTLGRIRAARSALPVGQWALEVEALNEDFARFAAHFDAQGVRLGQSAIGLTAARRPGSGWRREPCGMWVPDPRSPRGRQIAATMVSLDLPSPRSLLATTGVHTRYASSWLLARVLRDEVMIELAEPVVSEPRAPWMTA